MGNDGLRLTVITPLEKYIPVNFDKNKVRLGVKFFKKDQTTLVEYSSVILNESVFLPKVISVPIGVVCNPGKTYD